MNSEKKKDPRRSQSKTQDNTNRKLSQSQQILRHLQEGKSITPIDALNLFGCFRLSARIADLRHDGWQIKTDTITREGKQFASYSLEASK